MRASLISPAMRDAVGTELVRQVSHPVSRSDIRRWAIAVYWPDPPPSCFTGEQAAIAPEEFNPFAWSVAGRATTTALQSSDPDHLEAQAGIAGPGLRFMLNGGLETEYGVPMRAGDVITSVRHLGPYAEREGRLGPMLFSRTVDTWTNQRGELVKRVTGTLIRYGTGEEA